MRRLIGLYKEYDIIEVTEDVYDDRPEWRLKKDDIGTLISLVIGRGGASATIELHDEYWDSSETSLDSPIRMVELEIEVQPPIRAIDAAIELQDNCDSFNVFPDDHRFINIELRPRVQ
jgi:hypothetical protein